MDESLPVKATIPPDALPFYLEEDDLAHLSRREEMTKLWAKDLSGLPGGFRSTMVSEFLVYSPDKDFDGSLRSCKSLRACQLFEERHIRDVDMAALHHCS